MPELPDRLSSPDPEPSPAPPSPSAYSQHDGDEASVRLLLDALVRRLKNEPQELAQRALGREGDRTHPKA